MKSAAAHASAYVLSVLRVPPLLHKTAFRERLTVLTYHAVVPSPLDLYHWCFLHAEAFRKQMSYLRDVFEVLPLQVALARVRAGAITRPTAAVTFDDGYDNNFRIAYPILRELGVPATVFLTTGYLDSSDTIWDCRLHRAFSTTTQPHMAWKGSRFDLSSPALKAEAFMRMQASLKEHPHPQLLEETKHIVQTLGDDPHAPIEPGSPYRMLDERAVRDMAGSGLVDFGAHTRTHAILSRLPAADQRREMESSLSTVERLTGKPCTLFAYPNGRRCDYSEETISMLQHLGVDAAFTAVEGPVTAADRPMEMRRYGIGADMGFATFQLHVHHTVAWLRKLAGAVRSGINR